MKQQEEFRDILFTYQNKVYNQAFRMLGNREDAEEATQDIFLSVHRSLSDFRGESKMSTWIYRITSNVCISRLRKKQLDMASFDAPVDEEGTTLAAFIPDEGLNPETLMESEEAAEIIRSEVNKLPPDWAMAISLFHFDDLSYEEIAEIMALPKATVATYIHRGRKQLARQLIQTFSI